MDEYSVEHDSSTVSGVTFRRWFEMIESEADGHERLGEILKNLSDESREGLGDAPDDGKTYSQEIFDDFCDVSVAVFHGFDLGFRMGERSAKASRRMIIPLLESCGGEPLRFLRENLDTIYRLYNPFGSMGFNADGIHGGTVVTRGLPHHELLCYLNAGYVKKCLEFLDLNAVKAGPVLHEPNSDLPCRIRVHWQGRTNLKSSL